MSKVKIDKYLNRIPDSEKDADYDVLGSIYIGPDDYVLCPACGSVHLKIEGIYLKFEDIEGCIEKNKFREINDPKVRVDLNELHSEHKNIVAIMLSPNERIKDGCGYSSLLVLMETKDGYLKSKYLTRWDADDSRAIDREFDLHIDWSS